MASARVRHDEALGRPDAVHLFSDQIPVYRMAHAWLLEQKLEDDLSSFEEFRTMTTGELLEKLPSPPDGERRGGGLFIGSISHEDLGDDARVTEIAQELIGSYSTVADGFVAPYFDLAP